MGIVKKQAFQNSIIQYSGIVLGYINTVLLFPKIFDPDQFGLTRIFLAIATFYSSFGSLGSYKLVVRFFPFFSKNYKDKNGIFLISFLVALTGFVIMTILYLVFKENILENYSEKSTLFIDNYLLVIPLAFTMLFFTLFEVYFVSIKKTVLTFFLRNILLRLIWMTQIALYYFEYIDFMEFLYAFTYSNAIIWFILVIRVINEKQIRFPLKSLRIEKRVFKVMLSYSLFSIVSGISGTLVTRIDIIMVGFMLGLEEAAVYSIASYMISVILVPMSAINRILTPLISLDWKAKNYKNIEKSYKKTSITQLILGGWVFICIWSNIEEIFTFFPKEYYSGKYVVLILGLTMLANMITGSSNSIMSLTKYYKLDSYASLGLSGITVLFNLFFIPKLGVSGAALATLASMCIFHTYRVFVIRKYLKMQPFSLSTIKVLALLLSTSLIFTKIPEIWEGHFFVSILLKCIIITLVFYPIVYVMKVFPEMNNEVNKILQKVGITGRS